MLYGRTFHKLRPLGIDAHGRSCQLESPTTMQIPVVVSSHIRGVGVYTKLFTKHVANFPEGYVVFHGFNDHFHQID